jgi:hypothetical protein
MVVLNKKSFRLPRLEKEKFVLLMRLGLDYDRASGTFCIANCNNIEKLHDALVEILKEENVCFTQTCIGCRKDFSCQDCKYMGMCETKNLPFSCVCPQCLIEGKVVPE